MAPLLPCKSSKSYTAVWVSEGRMGGRDKLRKVSLRPLSSLFIVDLTKFDFFLHCQITVTEGEAIWERIDLQNYSWKSSSKNSSHEINNFPLVLSVTREMSHSTLSRKHAITHVPSKRHIYSYYSSKKIMSFSPINHESNYKGWCGEGP